ncbi:glutamate 5-kinase [Acinetobacter sp. MD2(2019)]|uniref:glutamate 5-kinase n=1 Tax=Acinetobacter sp. MD2(2019) TaxID=2605273 RepID=UPI002D1F68D4|nr:glutamate 5-kinase [Acinetobacter sp. MD2(2019)]MEB3753762.1 glutamate 5-kinase [Acinetobacter sp. MD2(2019)]
MKEVVNGQRELNNFKRIVVKIGSALLTANGQGLDLDAISHWAGQIAQLHDEGHEIILVSSGAVAEGMVRMKLAVRPTDLPSLQACAAIGQMGLVQTWSSVLEQKHIKTAQVLLTHDDLADRRRYLNSCDALQHLIDWRVIPVINENDTVSTDEIRFGDNDTLAAMVAGQVHADLLIILTDQQGMFDADPRSNPNAKLLSTVRALDDELFEMAGGGGVFGRGGMVTKVRAARLAAKSGCPTLIASGESENVLTRLMSGESLGTLFVTDNDRMTAHQQWLAAHLQTAGRLVIDAGAIDAIKLKHRSLLPVGVKAVEGHFERGDVVECVDQQGQRIAVGRVNFSSRSADIVKGLASDKVFQVLGEARSLEMIHRNHMAIY